MKQETSPGIEPSGTSPRSIFSGRPLERGERIQIAIFIGVAAALAAFIAFGLVPDMLARDFTYPWRGARALLAGENPYQVIRPSGPPPYDMFFMYPLTAAVVAVPFALLPAAIGGALFSGIGAATLAYVLSDRGLGRFWLFLSPPFLLAVVLAQWSPLLIAGALSLPVSWALACKPTIGAALFLFRPTWKRVIVGGSLVLVALALQPDWIQQWVAAARTVPEHYAPALRPMGVLALLTLLRWRRPEARLVAAMALVPQNLYFYDQLPLWLVASNGRRTLALTTLSWIAWWGTARHCHGRNFCGPEAEPWVIGLIYLPAAAMVLLDRESIAWLKRLWRRKRNTE